MKREPGENPGQIHCCEFPECFPVIIIHCPPGDGKEARKRDESEDLPRIPIV